MGIRNRGFDMKGCVESVEMGLWVVELVVDEGEGDSGGVGRIGDGCVELGKRVVGGG